MYKSKRYMHLTVVVVVIFWCIVSAKAAKTEKKHSVQRTTAP